MEDISRFRGMAGEVTGAFLLPTTFFSTIPILIVFVILGFLASIPKGPAGVLVIPLFVAVYAMVVGRFALRAKQGDFVGGFFLGSAMSGELLPFVGRYLALTLVWVSPLVLLTWLLVDKEVILSGMMGVRNPLYSAQLGLTGLLLTVIGVAALFMPTLSFIVATRAENLSEALSRDMWSWLLSDRRADLPAFYANLIGGMLVFFAFYLIPFVLFLFLSFKASPKFGAMVSGLLYLLMLAVSPILLGRMCGAFVAGERGFEGGDEIEDSGTRENVPPVFYVSESLATAERSVVLERKPSFGELSDKVQALSDGDLADAITTAEGKIEEHARDPHTAAELALLCKRAGLADRALKAGGSAIAKAVSDGFTEIGVELFKIFVKERAALDLNAQVLEVIGNVLLKQEAILEAGWCLHASAVKLGDALQAQKKLLYVASVAEEGGKTREAELLYDFFVKKYPDTPLTQFGKQGLERLRAAGKS